MTAPPLSWVFLSGIEANTTGAGRLLQHLQAAILKRGLLDGTILYSPLGKMLSNDAMEWLTTIPHLVLFHPQMLGIDQTGELIRRRTAQDRPTHLYLLDSYFFCRRSYNHIDPETAACLRCVGQGREINAERFGCIPWPFPDAGATGFIAALHEPVRRGLLRLFAQNRGQIELARAHFGASTVVIHAGLWCADWTEHFAAFEKTAPLAPVESQYDVVYHGSRDLAKGIGWVLNVAERTPELRYLIPIDRGTATVAAPANVTVTAMRWESGLADAVRHARLVLAPSLWSSPCEGALIKSIVTAKATGVIEVPSAFSSEVPNDVVLKLPPDPIAGAQAIRTALAECWQPDLAARRRWAIDFRTFNADILQRLLPAQKRA